MPSLRQRLITRWRSLAPHYLPFADVATPDLPLGRLLRLSLFQVSVGMTLVLLVGTLNRVMIVELDVPTSLVGIVLAMPLLFAPFRAVVGFRSDKHRCALGWRRVPFIWNGTLATFAGLSLMPFALLVLAGMGQTSELPRWIGLIAAAASFLLAGAGAHAVQTAGLALATDLTPTESHPRVVGLMYVSLLVGMMVSALVFGVLLTDFTPARLIQVIQGAAVATVVLNVISVWKQETRHSWQAVGNSDLPDATFFDSVNSLCSGVNARRRLAVIATGTLAFGMAELILEPFGGQVLSLSVSATTKLTALLALGGLLGFVYASRVLAKGQDAHEVARNGAVIGLPAFALVMLAAPLQMPAIFLVGNLLIGFGAALFGHGTLTATMTSAPKDKVGLALGSWGAVQATAAGVGIAMSAILRDVVNAVVGNGRSELGYYAVYLLEILLLLLTVIIVVPLIKPGKAPPIATEETGTSA